MFTHSFPALALGLLSLTATTRAQCEIASLQAPDADIDGFGSELAIDGDLLAVQDRGFFDVGRVHLFLRVADSWVWQQELTSPVSSGFDEFGTGLGVSGTTVAAVGAILSSSADVWIHEPGPNGWELVQTLPLEYGSSGQRGLALDGDLLLVGSPDEPEAGVVTGAVHAFERQAGLWTEVQRLLPGDLVDGGQFGAALALSRERVAIAGRVHGRVEIFNLEAGGWVHAATIHPPADAAGFIHGYHVSLLGSRLLVGAPPEFFIFGPGKAYLYEESGGNWSQVAVLSGSIADPLDQFGTSVTLGEDVAVVGAPFTSNGNGAVYVYREEASWMETAVFTVDGALQAGFGRSVLVDERRLLAGAAPNTDTQGFVKDWALLCSETEFGLGTQPQSDL